MNCVACAVSCGVGVVWCTRAAATVLCRMLPAPATHSVPLQHSCSRHVLYICDMPLWRKDHLWCMSCRWLVHSPECLGLEPWQGADEQAGQLVAACPRALRPPRGGAAHAQGHRGDQLGERHTNGKDTATCGLQMCWCYHSTVVVDMMCTQPWCSHRLVTITFLLLFGVLS